VFLVFSFPLTVLLCRPFPHVPSIHRLPLYPFKGRGGSLEPIPADIGWEAGYTLDRTPAYHSATFTPTVNLESPMNLTPFCMSLDCGRKPENPERTHAYTGRTCKLHTDRPWLNRDSNPEPSCCEVKVLTTTPRAAPFPHVPHLFNRLSFTSFYRVLFLFTWLFPASPALWLSAPASNLFHRCSICPAHLGCI